MTSNPLDMVKKKLLRPMPGYTFIRMYSIPDLQGGVGNKDLKYNISNQHSDDYKLVMKFFAKYPEVKYMPLNGPLHVAPGGAVKMTHPASHFIFKQKKLMK